MTCPWDPANSEMPGPGHDSRMRPLGTPTILPDDPDAIDGRTVACVIFAICCWLALFDLAL
jgi:hypothetical protein